MHPIAVVLAVTSAITHAWREMHTKQAHDKQIFVWWFGLTSLILYFPLFAWFVWTEGLTLMGIRYICLSGITHCFYWYFLSKSYEYGDLSHVYPIMRSSPAIVLVLSVIFLGEIVSVQAVTGVGAILLGMYMINMKQFSLRGFAEPIKALGECSTQYALLTAMTVAVYSITDKIGVNYIHPVIFSYGITLFVMIFNTFYIFSTKTRINFWQEWKDHPGMITINGFLTMFSYLLILIAFTFERVSYVTSVRQLSVVFGVLMGGHILRERHTSMRLIAAATILSGTTLIALAK
jgi:uncharacterized membrane protein